MSDRTNLRCWIGWHGPPKVQEMKRNGKWYDAPGFPLGWAGTRPSVRAVCSRCGKVLRGYETVRSTGGETDG